MLHTLTAWTDEDGNNNAENKKRLCLVSTTGHTDIRHPTERRKRQEKSNRELSSYNNSNRYNKKKPNRIGSDLTKSATFTRNCQHRKTAILQMAWKDTDRPDSAWFLLAPDSETLVLVDFKMISSYRIPIRPLAPFDDRAIAVSYFPTILSAPNGHKIIKYSTDKKRCRVKLNVRNKKIDRRF